MYYYAYIDPNTGVCYLVEGYEEPLEDPYCIPIDSLDTSLVIRKKYVDGQWYDSEPSEAQNEDAKYIGIDNVWLNERIYAIDAAIENHTHEGYASADDLDLLEDVVANKADAAHTHDGYAATNHTHDGYATQVALDTLADEVSGKADTAHSHTEYASVSHSHTEYADVNHNHNSDYAPISHAHSDYVTTTTFDVLETEVDGKADANHSHTDYALTSHTHNEYSEVGHSHSDYSVTTHNHDKDYSPLSHSHTPSEIGAAVSGHNHDSDYADINHSHDSIYAAAGHDHDEDYSAIGHSHSDYATVDSLTELSETVVGKANASHTHDDRYFTETEINSKLAAKADTSHTHTGVYDVNGAAESALESANAYTDSKIDAIVIPDALSDLAADTTHRTVTDAEKAAWNAKSDFSGSYNDLTDKPSIPSISGLATETYVDEAVSTKANSSHTHSIANVSGLQSALDAKSDASHNHNSSYDAKGAAASALSSANAYTDTAIDTLSDVVADKASASDLTSHTGNTTAHITSTERTNWNAAKTHANSAHAPANAEENQNAFSNVVVNGTTIAADSKTDTLTFVAGNNVTITPDATGDSITISSANTVYTHPATAGNKHIPAGGSSGQILRWASDGTATWGNDNNTTYSVATQTADGLMSDTDKTKLDGIAEGANNYVLPSAGASLGGVKSGGDVTIASGVITVNDDSHNHIISNIDGLQSALDGKAASGHNHDGVYYTETEVDTLLSGKANASHGTHVSYSTTAPVMDGSASVGTASTVARSDHKHPTDTSRAAQSDLTSHTSNKSNPHGVTLSQLGVTATASELNKMDGVTATTAELNILDGVTATTAELNYVDGVTSNIQTQLNAKAFSSHTHSAATTSANGLMSASDKAKLDGIASGANAYTLPTASSTLGGVKTTSTVTSNSGYTACPIIGGVPYYKDTNTTYNLGSFGVTATAAELNTLDGITATTAELNYCDGVTSNIQTQLNNKHTKGDNVAVEKSGSTPYVSLKVKDTSLETRIYKNANTTNDYGTIIQDYGSDGKRDALTLRRNTSLANKLTLKVQNADGTDVNYQIYGQHTPNLMSSNENGNCVIGWDNYDAGSGDTNIYGENVHIYARNSDGSLPAGAVFVGRNSNNHTLINNAAHLDTANISDTYIYGRAVHIDTNDTNFIVDSIQLAHTDKSSISSYSSGWTYYGTASANTPTVRRYGKVVSLTGALTNTSAVTLNTTHVKVFTIPSGYRPSQDVIVLCQGSGANEFVLQIKTDGGVYIGRYGTSSFSSIAAGQWFPFHVSWVME